MDRADAQELAPACRRHSKESGKMDRLRWLALLVLFVASPAMAEAPRVQFDLPYTVACRDVTPPNFAAVNPEQKLVEVRLAISSLVVAGEERDLTQYFIR